MTRLTNRLGLTKPNLASTPLITDLEPNWDLLDKAVLYDQNLADIASMPAARANLRVPVLSAAAVVVTSNLSALNTYKPVIDGLTVLPGMQVFLTAQTNPVQNGPWLVSNGPGIAWTRPADFASGFKLSSRLIAVSGGTTGAGQVWMLVTPTQITVDTDAQTWVRVIGDQSGAIAASQGAWSVVPKTTAYTAAAWDYVLADTTGGTFAVAAPTPVAGKQWGMRWKTGSVAPTLTGTFDVTPTFTAVTQAMEFISDGTTWYRNVRPALAQLPDYPAITDARYDLIGAAATAQGNSLQKASNLSDVASASTSRSNIGAAQQLARTAVKTSAYTAAAGDYVPVDTTSGAVTITLPTAPTTRCRVAVKHIIQGSTNAVTVACGGSDVFNKAGGSTSFTMPLLAQAAIIEYDPSTAIWTVITDDLPLSQLDLRYLLLSLFTTKGDLGVATGAGAVTRLGVGTDGYVLTADAAQTSGVKWAATSGGVPTSRLISAGTGLTGGGDLTADRTLAVSYGTASGTAAQGNDSRITGAVQTSRQVASGTGLTGGGDLSADRTLAVSYGTTSGTAAQGNDSRFTTIAATTQGASYTLVLGDVGTCIEYTGASAGNITVPPNSSVAFAVGSIIELCQYGAGQVTIVAGAGVTIRNPSSLTTRTQYSSVRLRKRATDEWVASGDVS